MKKAVIILAIAILSAAMTIDTAMNNAEADTWKCRQRVRVRNRTDIPVKCTVNWIHAAPETRTVNSGRDEDWTPPKDIFRRDNVSGVQCFYTPPGGPEAMIEASYHACYIDFNKHNRGDYYLNCHR
jgi:hypothetical protein